MERNFGYHGQSKEVDGMMRVWMTNNSSLSLQGHLVPTNPLVTRMSSVDISRFVRRTTSSFLSNSSDKRKMATTKSAKAKVAQPAAKGTPRCGGCCVVERD